MSTRTRDAAAASLVERLTETFSAAGSSQVGLEEELMLLDPDSLDLTPGVAELLAALPPDERFRPELPAAQLEIVLPPAGTVDELGAGLRDARRALAGHAASSGLLLAGAGAHPFAAPEGELNATESHLEMVRDYGVAARRQLVFGLHVHVGLRGPERVVAVHDALRSYLPDLAALGANAPFHAGRDTGQASIRPSLCDLLPRQGVPPALGSLQHYADALAWGAACGRFAGPHRWWWELRLHPTHGTIEVRVCDTQTQVGDTRGIVALIRALVHRLAERHDAGERLRVDETWRIEENRWLAARHGLDAQLVDLRTGAVSPARTRLRALVEELGPTAEQLGDGAALAALDPLLGAGGAERMRAAADGDPRAAVAYLAQQFAAV